MWRIEQVVEFLKALAQRDASLRSFSVGGEKISSAEFLSGWRAKI
ncbi:MAG: hypothetical protein ABSH06_11210 [Thermodesulfobacteriota bacterium]